MPPPLNLLRAAVLLQQPGALAPKESPMSFARQLVQDLAPHHLLKHPFYQAWSAGELSREDLGFYARQYFAHVQAFPRYISATHSQCADLPSRQVLLDNLMDEERGAENHPELWLRFAEGLGQDRQAVQAEEPLPSTQALVDTFMGQSREGYAQGLGALLAYEHQVPEVAASKLAGLSKFYGITDDRTLHFFQEHMATDTWHTEAAMNLADALDPESQELARQGAQKAAKALWGFLDGICQALKN